MLTPEEFQDEKEWAAIEAQHRRNERGILYPIGHRFEGPKRTNKAHPDSYRPDLPLWSALRNSTRAPKGLSAKEKKTLANRPLVFAVK